MRIPFQCFAGCTQLARIKYLTFNCMWFQPVRASFANPKIFIPVRPPSSSRSTLRVHTCIHDLHAQHTFCKHLRIVIYVHIAYMYLHIAITHAYHTTIHIVIQCAMSSRIPCVLPLCTLYKIHTVDMMLGVQPMMQYVCFVIYALYSTARRPRLDRRTIRGT